MFPLYSALLPVAYRPVAPTVPIVIYCLERLVLFSYFIAFIHSTCTNTPDLAVQAEGTQDHSDRDYGISGNIINGKCAGDLRSDCPAEFLPLRIGKGQFC